jgi:hypothetical protein
MQVAGDYCPTAYETFSLLPDCLASRCPSDLDDLERVVSQVALGLDLAETAVQRPTRLPSL